MLKFRLEERNQSPYWLLILSPFIAMVAIVLAGILIVVEQTHFSHTIN